MTRAGTPLRVPASPHAFAVGCGQQPSCQLSTYFVGRTAFHRLRQKVQRAQDDRFDLGRYHEAVLSHGTMPVKYLPELATDP